MEEDKETFSKPRAYKSLNSSETHQECDCCHENTSVYYALSEFDFVMKIGRILGFSK